MRSFHYTTTNSGTDGSFRPKGCKSTSWSWLGCALHRLRKVTPFGVGNVFDPIQEMLPWSLSVLQTGPP